MSKTQITRRTLIAAVSSAALLGLTACGGVQGASKAADYPTKAIEFIVPVAPGGSTDTLSRAIAKGLSEKLGQPVAVINKPGGGATVGLTELKNAGADGYKIGMIPSSPLAVRPLAVKDATPLSVDDFTVIKALTVEDVVLFTYKDSPVQTADDVLALKGKPIKYSSSGAGTVTGTAQAVFFSALGADATGVPFDGGAPAKTAVLGKQVEVGGAHPGEIAQEVKAGTLVPLLTFSEERSQFFPDVPTAKELGISVAMDQRRFLGAPKNLPQNVLDKLVEATETALKSEDYAQVLKDGYFARNETDGATASSDLKANLENYKKQVSSLGVNLGG
ncbi:ABC transporter substrate-binding protein [Paenarthrobacter nitroguajacolicus]|uniref:Bug family tripartite tricarboxylate transporter substrate binding protein n=1 Tax=Paenarthrobacter nitroguajacolicus TaxID=211146 RepID=UPI0015BF9572|nr:tripartite tricarboxylate transporter substrate binding protein [Paenarthrobacter nitroguajacolicus]NWL10323.1 ABC transporter substrate-binding protein [Paenarthrobacter nitroguajacolicus]